VGLHLGPDPPSGRATTTTTIDATGRGRWDSVSRAPYLFAVIEPTGGVYETLTCGYDGFQIRSVPYNGAIGFRCCSSP
jgi:hypothetical protein